MCCAYGFQMECRSKYDNITFGMFVQIFHHLPLATIINQTVMVVHGGLFHSKDVLIEDLNHITRHEFTLIDLHLDATTSEAVPREQQQEFLRQLQRDALWSDPTMEPGLHINPRGAGVGFGPDVAVDFLKRNNLKLVVRSHECVDSGFELPFAKLKETHPEYADIMCTVFSASNYSGGDNDAAYLVFSKKTHKVISLQTKEIHYVNDSDLMYSVNYFYTGYGLQNDAKTEVGDAPERYGETLYDIILMHKELLLSEFRLVDKEKKGCVTRSEWIEVMQRVCMVQIYWDSVFRVMVPVDCIKEAEGSSESQGGELVIYEPFLDSFVVKSNKSSVANEALSAALEVDQMIDRTPAETETDSQPSVNGTIDNPNSIDSHNSSRTLKQSRDLINSLEKLAEEERDSANMRLSIGLIDTKDSGKDESKSKINDQQVVKKLNEDEEDFGVICDEDNSSVEEEPDFESVSAGE